MSSLAVVVSIVSLLLVVILGSATSELFLQVRTLQGLVGYEDEPSHLEGVVEALETVDLTRLAVPSPPTGHGALLFLSTSCSTCQRIATLLKGTLPQGLQLVLVARGEADADEWIERVGLDHTRISVDLDQEISRSYSVSVSPTLLRTADGRCWDASVVPSFRTLKRLLEEVPTYPTTSKELQ